MKAYACVCVCVQLCVTVWLSACVYMEVILGFLLTAAGCGQIYSVADATKGHKSVLSLCYTIWLHLFMEQGYTMGIGRLSKASFNSKMSWQYIF